MCLDSTTILQAQTPTAHELAREYRQSPPKKKHLGAQHSRLDGPSLAKKKTRDLWATFQREVLTPSAREASPEC